MKSDKVAVLTISSHNYMSYGLNCLMSAKEFNYNYDMYYLIADEYKMDLYSEYEKGISFVCLSEIGISDRILRMMEFKYNIIEFNTCVKPAAMKWLLSLGYNTVIYLDPDIECYASFDNLVDSVKDESIVVTPHKMSSDESSLIKDEVFLNNGIYNLGFIAVNNCAEGVSFLNWWNSKLIDRCYIDYSTGLATDQIWVELASTIFDGFYVCKNPGLNVAFWNLNERIIKKEKGKYMVNNMPLLFFHYSSLSLNYKKELVENIKKNNPEFESVFGEHLEKVKKYKPDFYSGIKYGFDSYFDGCRISPQERRLYGLSEEFQRDYYNPFECCGNNCYRNKLERIHVLNRKNATNSKEKILCIVTRLFGLRKTLNLFSGFNYARIIARMLVKNDIYSESDS